MIINISIYNMKLFAALSTVAFASQAEIDVVKNNIKIALSQPGLTLQQLEDLQQEFHDLIA